ncbi:MBL fold metallo-hydrolase [Actinacidiphila bryophytorum]|uniref:MBL fold metallo-hydrolase n=1 Tax=Actinacidiphila bryophytorum TaxID=1436133 RepID=UPI002176B179|nr:MBL fold metallo-hydrolase [Actinacidiphila bryophytorum]UWE07571.1 MBL fold metallo-hydrolase [Actinacidiphila bryophytorum]
MQLPICRTCGVQYGAPRLDCPICLDERQYVGWEGQQWTTLAELRAAGHRGRLDEEGPGVVGVGAAPSIAVGQRALLIRSPSGNVLWDGVGYLDDELGAQIEELGGISAIAVSHPHFYGVMTEWGRAFDAPVYVHEADREWVARPDPLIEYWTGDTHSIAPGMTLINAGTHFAGGTVLHWADDPEGRGALLSTRRFHFALSRLEGGPTPDVFVWVSRENPDVDAALDALLDALGIGREALTFVGDIETGFVDMRGSQGT